jgi:hypothetical protein
MAKNNSAKAAKVIKMNPNVTANEVSETVQNDPTKIVGVVTRKVKNPFDGTMIERKANFELPAAYGDDPNVIMAIVGQKWEEIIFWFNHGRKVAARQQLNQMLAFDLGSDELNDLYDSFNDAMDSLLTKDATPEKRKRIKDFILSEDKFAILKIALDDVQEKGIDELNVKFGSPDATGKVAEGETELKKPSGKKGAPRKVKPGETVSEDEETES